MPTGLSGDSSTILTIGNDPVGSLQLIEDRIQSMLLQQGMGTQALDDLDRARTDIAVQLGIAIPLTGATN